MHLSVFSLSILYLSVIDGKLFRFDYDYFPEAEGWLKLHRIPATWKNARLRCFREDSGPVSWQSASAINMINDSEYKIGYYYLGAVLASPENSHLNAAITKLMNISGTSVSCGLFTGVHATYSKGDYYSMEGTSLDRMPVRWASGEPDNAHNAEDCLLMLPGGTLADVNCSDVYPYVCYRKKTMTSAVSNCGTVDNSYTLDPRTGSCYKFHTEPQVWGRAFSACSGEGGHLAIINSATEAQVLKELFARNANNMPGNFIKNVAILGFSDWEEHGLWVTIHGQTLAEAGYNTWSTGQPDNASAEYCGAMFADARLDDVWCDRPCPFICEKKPDSLLTDDEM